MSDRQPNHPNLLRGGNYGNRGGGRPKKEFQEAARKSCEERRRVLEKIVDDYYAGDKTIRPAEVVQAMALLHKMTGYETQKDVKLEDDQDVAVIDKAALEAFKKSVIEDTTKPTTN